MNLIRDPWIPIAFGNGQSELVSLLDAFRRGEEIRDFVATPPQRIALTRLLVCIAQAALDGPADEADWRSCYVRIASASIAYLENKEACFDLFGDHAFLQVANLTETNNATLDKLGIGLAAGNNATLFDHGADVNGRSHLAAWSALALLTYQCFSTCGTIGTSSWNGLATSSKSLLAPCLEQSMMHTILRGGSILATVHLNLLTKKVLEAALIDWGQPVWERMPTRPSDGAAATYLGRLVPVSRGVRLTESSRAITLVEACRYTRLPEYREPFATVIQGMRSPKKRYRRVDPARHPWRDLGSVLTLSQSWLEGGPFAVEHLEKATSSVDLWTGGALTDRSGGKIVDTAEWTFSIAPSQIGEGPLTKYRQGVKLADDGERCLRHAIATYLIDLKVDKSQHAGFCGKASPFYWRALDSRYGLLVAVAHDRTRSLGDDWYGTVRSAMERAYERACGRQSARQIRAYAKGSQRLRLRRPGHREASVAA
jgi:CRISPR system Cascade subunit CasA